MNIFVIVGLLINAGYILINRFVVNIPNKVAIPVLLTGIACLIAGFVQMKQQGMT